MSKVPLPQPVLDTSKKKIEGTKDHGLWGFFNAQRNVLSTPDEDDAFGMASRIMEPCMMLTGRSRSPLGR